MNRKNHLSIGPKGSAAFVLLLVLVSMMLSSCSKTHEEPKLIVSADTLFFKGNETLSLYVTTDNTERREFYVNCPDSWISVSPQSGRIMEGDTVELKLTSFMDDFLTFNEGFLYLSSAFDEKKVKLIGVPEDYYGYALPDTLFFPQDEDNAILHIKNYGNVTLHYSITASTNFVSFTPASGEVPMLEQADVTVTIDRENLLSMPYPALYVTIDDTVDTVLLVPEKKLMLPNDVIDAEYAKATDMLVYVAADATLNIYHPDTRTLSSISLNYTPTCVSVSPDGTKAVVGHDAHVTYVDLMSEEVLTTNDLSCDALDIVLTDNGWTYVFPRRDQWTRIVCLNVSTNNATETLHTGYDIYAGTKAKLHPSGKYIYGADNGLSPSDIEKYDIQNGTAQYLYDSPYHGDYYMGGDLWFEENGERLFTRAGTVFKTSEMQSMDMIYNGKITLEGSYRSIVWLDQLDQKREIYLVTQAYTWYDEDPLPPYVYVYNSDNLSYKTKMRLEDYSVVNGDEYMVYAANPYFVFAHSNGTQLYVITKATGSGMVHEWAIQTIELE
jgi:hypothetical protein